MQSKEPDSALSIILENCSQLQSLDLRGLTLNLHFLSAINKFCPDLECLHLNAVKMESDAFYYLHTKIAPKLSHLSIDNLFEITDWNKQESVWHHLFSGSANLQDLKLDLFPVESQFISSSLSELRGLVFLHLNLFSRPQKPNPIKLKDLMKNLTEGLGRNIEFLRLYSEEENTDNNCCEITSDLRKLNDLKALNLDLKDINHFTLIYELVNESMELESLTLNLGHNSNNSQEILKLFFNCNFREKLCRLKLSNILLSEEICNFLKTDYKQFISIQLIDIFVDNYDSFIEFLSNNKKLLYLLLKLSSQSNMKELGHNGVPPEEKFLEYISNTENLDELDLINCQIDANKFHQICKLKDIKLYHN